MAVKPLAALSGLPVGTKPKHVLQFVATKLSSSLGVSDTFTQAIIRPTDSIRELAYLAEANSVQKENRERSVLERCGQAAARLHLTGIQRLLDGVPAQGAALRTALQCSGDTFEISEAALVALDPRLLPLGTLLGLPAGERVSAVAARLKQDYEAGQAADRVRDSAPRASREGSGGADGTTREETWNARKLAKLTEQWSQPVAQLADAAAAQPGVPAIHAIYALYCSGSPIAQLVAASADSATTPGVPATVARVASLHPAFKLYLEFVITFGRDLPFTMEEGQPLVPQQVRDNFAACERFPEELLTDKLVKCLRNRQLAKVTMANLAHFFQAALSVTFAIELRAAPSIGECAGAMQLLEAYLASFLLALGIDPVGIPEFLASLTNTHLVLTAQGLSSSDVINRAVSVLFEDIDVRASIARNSPDGPDVMLPACVPGSATEAHIQSLDAALATNSANTRAERQRAGGRLTLLPMATGKGAAVTGTPPATGAAPGAAAKGTTAGQTPGSGASGGGGGGGGAASGASFTPPSPPLRAGHAGYRVTISASHLALTHGQKGSTVVMFFSRSALEKAVKNCGSDPAKVNLSWLVANQDSPRGAASYINITAGFGGPNRPMVLPDPDWFRKRHAKDAVDTAKTPAGDIAAFFR